MATATAIKQKEENPMKPTDQQQQPPSDPSSNNNAASSTRQQPPSSTTVTDSYRKDGDESKALATGVLEGSTAVRDDDNVKDEPVSVIQKKIRRAERFGMPVQLSEEEKRNSRAERFGTLSAVHGSDALKKSEEHKRKARAERFGLLQSVPADEEAKKKASVPADEEAKKKARLARFGALPKTDPLEDDKKKARAIRFSQPPSGSLSQKSGKGNNIETKTAIAGKAGGGT